jgi:hypothetical protein
MTSAFSSLHAQIEKWFGAVQSASVRIDRSAASSKQKCITVSHTVSPYTIVFFQHSDGSWQVYPPRREYPMFSTGEKAA